MDQVDPPTGPDIPQPHPRKIGWLGATALAMGGSNQSIFLLSALFIGQGSIPGQGSAAVPLLMVGLLLSYMAMPGWTELCCMFPNRVGGIAATCSEAFRPYSPILANLTGVCYWWGWVPTCGLTALLSAAVIQAWLLPGYPEIHCLPAWMLTYVHAIPEFLLAGSSKMEGIPTVPLIAVLLVLFFLYVNLLGMQWISRLAVPIALVSGTLAFLSAVIPVMSGHVDWVQASSFSLTVPFEGVFGKITSAMAGLYIIGFAAPAFEAAYCHVGEMKNPEKNVPRAAMASALMAGLYFAVLPMIWLGSLGSESLGKNLAQELGPTFAPLMGGAGRFAAMFFMMFNMFHGTMAPTAGVCRTLSQLADDGLMPRVFAKRNRHDAPYVAAIFTAVISIIFLLMGDPLWLIAAANMTYLIGIALPSVAVWLLRRDAPGMARPYRARRGTIALGMIAAIGWGLSTVLGFEQFGLPTVIVGVVLAYCGAALYGWRKWSDRRRLGLPANWRSLHVKLTGAMLLVLVLDATGYLLAVNSIPAGQHPGFVTALADIFVAVALLTIGVGLVLPGMIAHSAVEVSKAATTLVQGTLADFTRAMEALSAGRLEQAHARIDVQPVPVTSRDEVGQMASSFNTLQDEVLRAARGLDGAREGLAQARNELQATNAHLETRVAQRTSELEETHKQLLVVSRKAGMAEVATSVLHNVGNVLNSLNISVDLATAHVRQSPVPALAKAVDLLNQNKENLSAFLTADERGKRIPGFLDSLAEAMSTDQERLLAELKSVAANVEHIKCIVSAQQSNATVHGVIESVDVVQVIKEAVRVNASDIQHQQITLVQELREIPTMATERHAILQILVNLISNAIHALANSEAQRQLSVGAWTEERENGIWAVVEVADNGTGIEADHLNSIFNHGFTTRKDGHGFGLHSSANAAKNLGGSLTARSTGVGQGATFRLELPHNQQGVHNERSLEPVTHPGH